MVIYICKRCRLLLVCNSFLFVIVQTRTQGFLTVVGKFDGDPFERLYLKINQKENKMLIRIETGEEVEFDLTNGIFVCEDPQDTSVIVCEYRTTIVVFKFENAQILQIVLSQMPQSVFDIQDSDNSTVTSFTIKSGTYLSMHTYTHTCIHKLYIQC